MWTASYDNRDNLVELTSPAGDTLTAQHDARSRLTNVTTPDNTLDYGYDLASNLTSANDNDSDIQFTYDALNRVATAVTGTGGVQPIVTLTNVYDAVGNRTTLTDSVTGSTVFGYDDAGRLNALTSPGAVSLTLSHDAAGRITSIARPNGVDTGYSYNSAGQLAQLSHEDVSVTLSEFGLSYDSAGSLTSIAELTQTRLFTYDDLQRLVSGGTATAPESYSYDAEGNRTASHLSSSHAIDAANRLLGDDQFSYTYDANGNLTSKTDLVSLDTTTYSYDAQNQLVRIDFPGGAFVEYAYDALGRRIQKTDGTIATKYVYDGEDIVLEFDGADALQASYTHGDRRDQPLLMDRGGQTFFYHADHLGSLRLLTDSLGAAVNSYGYDSYGNFESRAETVSNPFTFTGREFDPESGLYYYRARYYDPLSGRFLSEDPLDFFGGTLNLYSYVFNDPLNLVDPFGLQATERALVDSQSLQQAADDAVLGSLIACLFLTAADAVAQATGGDLVTGFFCNAPRFPAGPIPPTVPVLMSEDNGGTSPTSGTGGDGDTNAQSGAQSGNPNAYQSDSSGDPNDDPCGGPGEGKADKFSREPKSLQDRMALEEAMRGAGEVIIDSLNDPPFLGMQKVQLIVKSVQGNTSVVHYVRDPNTGWLMDFKFKKHSTGEICD